MLNWPSALASKLITVLSIKPGSRLLGQSIFNPHWNTHFTSLVDVGFGTGESLLYILSSVGGIQPIHLTGLTDNPSHCERARQRIHSRFPDHEKDVCLVAADAISHGSPNHPLSSSSEFQPFDAIMALDCAYHFNTRQRFLEQSFSRLTSGGRIALADICFSEGSLTTVRTRATTSLLRMMPMPNRISVKEYRQQMETAGYIDVTIENITTDVFPAFISFLKGQGLNWWLFATIFQIYTSSGAQYVVVSGRKP